MTVARAATAAAVAGLVAVAAWFAPAGSISSGRLVAAAAPTDSAQALDWQFAAADFASVPAAASEGAAAITVAVVDTGVDLSSPDLAGRRVSTHAVAGLPQGPDDPNGHGTFVTSLLARSSGAAPLLVIRAARADGSVTDRAEAKGIRYAVDHGARVINLSLAGTTTSTLERSAIAYAVHRGVLVVAAAGNAFTAGNPVEYPAALLQPVGSNGRGGAGLVVGASTPTRTRAPFSSSGSWISLAAPGVGVGAGISGLSSPTAFPRAVTDAAVGYGSGTSYAAPQVAGAAALVWAVKPSLTARQVADILKATASGQGAWTPDLGYGVVDAAAAVARAQSLG